MADPRYSDLYNSRIRNGYWLGTYPTNKAWVISFEYLSDLRGRLDPFFSSAGHRVELSEIVGPHGDGRNHVSYTGGNVGMSDVSNGRQRVLIRIPYPFTNLIVDRVYNRIRVYNDGLTYDFRFGIPFHSRILFDRFIEIFELGHRSRILPDSFVVRAITADMFEVDYTISDIPLWQRAFLDLPDQVLSQGDSHTTYEIPLGTNTKRFRGHVDNRVLAVWNISLLTRESLPVFRVHHHFEPWINPNVIAELRAMGISVYIDGTGLVHFPNFDVYESYFSAYIAGEKFNREWLESRAAAKESYAKVASDIPDKVLAKKDIMASRYSAAIDSPNYDRAVNRFKNTNILSELFDAKLDSIVELNQAKVEKVVRSVIKKRNFAARLDAILDYYSNNPNSSVSLPPNLSLKVIKSLVSQPLSKLINELQDTQTDAQIAEILAPDLITRLGFSRRVTA